MKLFFILLLSTITAGVFAQRHVNVPVLKNNCVYIKDASTVFEPGDTVDLQGSYLWVKILNLKGTADKPIIIRNKGLVKIGGFKSYTFIVQGSYFKVLGNGDPSYKYGILTNYVLEVQGAHGIELGWSDHYEIAWLELQNASCGVHSNPVAGGPMSGIRIHNNYIHKLYNKNPGTNGRSEGAYIGTTGDTVLCSTATRFQGLEFDHNIIDSVQGTGLQFGGGDNFYVHDNKITRFGLGLVIFHKTGLRIGGLANGRWVNNIIDYGRGHAIEILGSGKIVCDSNTISNIDTQPDAKEDLVYINTHTSPCDGMTTLEFSNNNISGTSLRFAINNSSNQTLIKPVNFSRNKITGNFKQTWAVPKTDIVKP